MTVAKLRAKGKRRAPPAAVVKSSTIGAGETTPWLGRSETFTGFYPNPDDFADADLAHGYAATPALVQVLGRRGDDLSRDNILARALNRREAESPPPPPGIEIEAAGDDYDPLRPPQLAWRKGESRELFGDLIPAQVNPRGGGEAGRLRSMAATCYERIPEMRRGGSWPAFHPPQSTLKI